MSKASADYHQDMNSDVFESWLEKQLLPNLPQKCILIIDNASYHSRQEVKVPTQATKKAEILEFMMKRIFLYQVLSRQDLYFQKE